jgi:hypothetical protein
VKPGQFSTKSLVDLILLTDLDGALSAVAGGVVTVSAIATTLAVLDCSDEGREGDQIIPRLKNTNGNKSAGPGVTKYDLMQCRGGVLTCTHDG